MRIKILSILLCGVLSIYAQDSKDYLLLKINIEVEGRTIGSSVDWGKVFGGPGGVNTYEFSHSKTWKAFIGPYPISEELLYRTAGYDVQADQVRLYKNSATSMAVGGILIAITGLGLIGYSAKFIGENDENQFYTYLTTGSLTSTIGIILEAVGFSKLRKKWGPASFAVDVADRYNEALKERINKK